MGHICIGDASPHQISLKVTTIKDAITLKLLQYQYYLLRLMEEELPNSFIPVRFFYVTVDDWGFQSIHLW
uniref:Uncharacterized protein n=1 Tax=Physcomitrium patens TaxID=3218 RepID=A0A2K1K7E5_PHYPA|nr:hypothetical protein PHYPA_011583 [Physcomitrium patens]